MTKSIFSSIIGDNDKQKIYSDTSERVSNLSSQQGSKDTGWGRFFNEKRYFERL